MKKNLSFFLLLLIILSIISSGCITPSVKVKPRYVIAGVHFDMNYTDIERINVSEVKPQLNAIGFVVEESPLPPGFTLRNYTQANNKTVEELTIFVSAYEKKGEKKGDFIVDYVPHTQSRDDESEKDNITAYIKMRANEVATICNLTLDWNKAEWGWGYEP